MNYDAFEKVLKTFCGEEYLPDKDGYLVFEYLGNLIDVYVSVRNGSIYVKQNNAEFKAEDWIIRNLVRMDLLARKILDDSTIQDEEYFVTPSCTVTDMKDGVNKQESDAVHAIIELLKSGSSPFVTDIGWILSDAGEGKTTVINRVSRLIAQDFLDNKSNLLVVPFPLKSKPMIRFDDLIIGTLSNMYRYNYLYWESFIELAKLGLIVPALDGFEEMFVESDNKDNTYSSLGYLVNLFQSKGSILIASRLAYFDYLDIEKIAKIDETLHFQYSNIKIHIDKWGKTKFVEYSGKRGINNPEGVHSQVLEIVRDEKHAVLTRPFLVKKLVTMLVEDSSVDPSEFLKNQSHKPDEFLIEFIESAIIREQSKWIDMSDPMKSLITNEQHFGLLNAIAQEMWVSNTDTIDHEYVKMLVEIFSEDENFRSSSITQQLIERMSTHVLLLNDNGKFYFEHDEFRNIFLSKQIAMLINSKDRNALRALYRKGLMPESCPRYTAIYIRRDTETLNSNIEFLIDSISNEPMFSLINENTGRLISKLIVNVPFNQQIKCFNSLLAIAESFDSSIINIMFDKCRFQLADLKNFRIDNCSFTRCYFDKLAVDVYNKDQYHNTIFCENNVQSLCYNQDHEIFDPTSIEKKIHAVFSNDAAPETVETFDPDETMTIVDRVMRLFLNRTTVGEGVMRIKLGQHANLFFKEIFPELAKVKLLEETRPDKGGNKTNYQMNPTVNEYNVLLNQSKGMYSEFLKLCKAKLQ